MDPEQARPGMIVTLHADEQWMVILWLEGTEWGGKMIGFGLPTWHT